MTNQRAAEAMALETFDGLTDPQQTAIMSSLIDHRPRVRVSTNAHTRGALARAGLVDDETRHLTAWGEFVRATARRRQTKRGLHA